MPSTRRKGEPIEDRVTACDRLPTNRATSAICLTVEELACEGARQIPDEQERMVLTGADRDAFVDAILNPAEPTEALVSAFRRHQRMLSET